MNYFLGFFPDQKTNYKIRKVVGELGRVFDGQEIKVRWVQPETYHVQVLYLGNSMNLITKTLLGYKLGKFQPPKFEIRFDKASLGISRKYKELVYLSISDGGDELRNLVFDLRNHLGFNDSGQFIPHLTLGRVSKDLTEEEFKNLNQDVRVVNKKLKVSDISFSPSTLAFVESDLESNRIIKEF